MESELLSHPKITLDEHLTSVYLRGIKLFEKNRVFSELKRILEISLLFHDLGKASKHFQNYIRGTELKSNSSRHSGISAAWTYLYLSKLLKLSELDSLLGYLIVRKHHNNFDDIKQMLIMPDESLLEISENIDYDKLVKIYSKALDDCIVIEHDMFVEFLKQLETKSLYRRLRRHIKSLPNDYWIKLNYLFSILVYADKEEAIFHSKVDSSDTRYWKQSFVPNYIQSLPKTESFLNSLRAKAFNNLNELTPRQGIQSINLPTGLGKTLSTLNYAIKLKDSLNSNSSIIYCLPFTSIIDQNFNVFKNVFQMNNLSYTNNALLSHHHLVDLNFIGTSDFSLHESEFLIETWNSELIVTTFVQIILTLFSFRNTSLKRFHKLANSIIILDEVQSIPSEYWSLIRKGLQAICDYMNATVILVTATMPLIFEKNTLVELISDKESFFGKMNRVTLDVSLLNKKTDINTFIDTILGRYNTKPDINRLIIVNTIQCSIQLYEALRLELDSERLIYLSSNVIPKHRLSRINKIKAEPGKGFIIVSTQVVEAGVDIDVEEVYRDLAPLDSVIQASGRCNRNAIGNQGNVVLIQLTNNNRFYWSFVYDQVLIQATTNSIVSLNKMIIPEIDYPKLTKRYYYSLNEAIS